MSHCTKCGHHLKASERFCTRCGATIRTVASVAPSLQVQVLAGAKCLPCGITVPAGKQFCPRCGLPLRAVQQVQTITDAACPQCSASVPAGKRFCTRCGYTLNNSQQNQSNSSSISTINPVLQQRHISTTARCAMCGVVMAASRSFCTHCGANVVRIGRARDNDVVLDYPMIADHHARITVLGDAALIEALETTHSIALNSPDKKIISSRLSKSDTVYFGSFPLPAVRLLAGSIGLGKKPHTLLNFSGQTMLLGRAPDCDVVLNHPMVAYHHARILRSNTGYIVEDLGLTSGTFVNGQRISGSVPISVGDCIGIGSYSFDFTAPDQIKQRDYRGNVTLEARGVTVTVTRKRKRLVEDTWLTIYPSEIVALMGPSGAGKTTLMNALNGYTPPSGGTVLINGQDLYANYSQFCGHIGYVPQDDIMHRELTVGQALYYTARLRLPADHSKADIEARIKSILKLLDLEGTEDVLIGSPEKKGISGGQRKRVNLAMELMTDPSILFLDEPTSGLSSEDALMVMKVLRDLANGGKTVLITIHQPGLEVFRLADTLLMVSKDKNSKEPAKMVYFGPAYPDAVEFFNPNGIANAKPGVDPSPDEIMRGLSKGQTAEWLRQYSNSQYKRQYVDERLGKRPSDSSQPIDPKMKRDLGLAQWQILVKRCLAIKIKDKWNTAILLAQAPIIASLLALVFGKMASDERYPMLGKTFTTLFLLIVSAIWLGCSNAAREIVSEWAVYHRERMVNLKIPSYIASKFTVLGGLCVIQCSIMLTIVYNWCHLQGSFVAMLGVLILASVVALALGLITSAMARTSEVAIALVPVLLLPMMFLGGMIQPVHDMMDVARPIASVIPARWTFEALVLLENEGREPSTDAATVPRQPLNRDADPSTMQPAPPGSAEHYFPKKDQIGSAGSIGILIAMLAVLIVGMMKILKTRDVH
jgi:ABC-type multidrug transport system ATPase subunit/predicted nucleic acid-binding Zn ribbon protein